MDRRVEVALDDENTGNATVRRLAVMGRVRTAQRLASESDVHKRRRSLAATCPVTCPYPFGAHLAVCFDTARRGEVG